MHLFLFADIYGFSAMVDADPESVMEKLTTITNHLVKRCDYYNSTFSAEFSSFVMSDNIMLLSPINTLGQWSDQREIWSHFVALVREMYVHSFNKEMPMRGCVTYGEISHSSTHIVGNSVTQAVRIETSFKIPMIFVPRFTINQFNELRCTESGAAIEMRFENIPFNDGLISAAPILPTDSDLDDIISRSKNYLEIHLANPKLAKSAHGWSLFLDLAEKWKCHAPNYT